jgi:hypothetical protein
VGEGKELTRRGKRSRKFLCRRAGGSRTRTRKEAERPARAGTAPREGKALEGISKGTRAAWNKAAKRRGATERRRVPQGIRAVAASEAGTVERGKNPEDGTDEGLAILVSQERSQDRVCEKGAPDVVAFEGERTPGEADPRAQRTAWFALVGHVRRMGKANAKAGASGRIRRTRAL